MTVSAEEKIDKSTWGPGPWMDEPDRLEWRHEGFPCLIVREPSSGHLCGYVAIPSGHPWRAEQDPDIEVHGGVTYASKCSGSVCHVPLPGESDDVLWIGFDFAHWGDLQPGRWASAIGRTGTYRTVGYVKSECERVVAQAKAAQ